MNVDETIAALSEVVDIQPRDKRRFKRLVEESRSFESLADPYAPDRGRSGAFYCTALALSGVDIKARLFRTYPLGRWVAMRLATSGASIKGKRAH